MVSKIKPQISDYLENLVRPFAYRVNPDIFSYLLIVCSFITFYLFATANYLWAVLSLILGLLDTFDGVFARAGNRTSKWGAYLDAVIDRVSEALIYIGIIASGAIRPEIGALALAGSLLVSYSKAKAEGALGESSVGLNQLSIGIAERAERIVLIGVFGFFYYLNPLPFKGINILEIGMAIISLLCGITISMRMYKAYSLLHK